MEDVATRDNAALIEKVVVGGNIESLTPAERMNYYMSLCHSLGLNPLTRPFDMLKLNGKLVLYANKECAAQLRKRHKVSITDVTVQPDADGFIVTVHARNADGQEDVDVGAIYPGRVQGENKANAIMKAITKAKRRVTLSICGLGFLDETEVASIPGAQVVPMQITEDPLRDGNDLPFSEQSVEDDFVESEPEQPAVGRIAMVQFIKHCWSENGEAEIQQRKWLKKRYESDDLDGGDLSTDTIKTMYDGWVARKATEPAQEALAV